VTSNVAVPDDVARSGSGYSKMILSELFWYK
jgi:hypothetical protein